MADFRKDNGKPLQAACAAFVPFVRGEGLLGTDEAVVAIDGSKFKASAAVGTVVDEAGTAARREWLAERVDQYLAQTDEIDAAEAGADEPQAGLTDPDAVALRGGLAGYNVQQAVDGQSKLIVALEVTQQANDRRSLAPTAVAAQAALGVESLTVVADTGDMNGEQAQHCEDASITPVVPMQQAASTKGEDLGPKTAFVYEPATDTCRCPAPGRCCSASSAAVRSRPTISARTPVRAVR